MDRIGELIADPTARKGWRDMVQALHEAALPGGHLEGYIFHGTSADRARAILDEGMDRTFCITSDAPGDSWYETTGTHWGIPKVAAFYAEDLIESLEDRTLPLAILAVRVEELRDCGPFHVDGQTLDCPLVTRLDASEEEISEAWDRSPQSWEDCLRLYGTLLVLGTVGPGSVAILRDVSDVEAMSVTGPVP